MTYDNKYFLSVALEQRCFSACNRRQGICCPTVGNTTGVEWNKLLAG